MSKVFHCKVKLPDTQGLLEKCNLETGGEVQKLVDKLVIEYSAPYCPFETGTLADSPKTASTPGKVVYNTPYARYLYYGKVYGPSFPIFDDDSGVPTDWRSRKGIKKHPTGKDLTYVISNLSPYAGAFWVERMKADHMGDIVEEVQAFVNDHI